MPYQDVFVQFWEEVKKSTQNDSFAKLTMAKTIGKLDLKNIFLRPVYAKDEFKVLLKLRYRSRETEDVENKLSLEEAFPIIQSHLRQPFFTVILFSTTKDITFRINKKGVGSISEKAPTFQDVTLVE